MYVSVIGSLKGLQERKRATAFAIRYVTFIYSAGANKTCN